MLLDMDLMLDKMVQEQLKVSHLEKKITSKVIPIKKANKILKDAIKDEYDEKLLKDIDYIILCYENEIAQSKSDDEKNDNEKNDDEKEPIETSEENTEKKDSEEPSFGVDTEEDTEDTEEDTEEASDKDDEESSDEESNDSSNKEEDVKDTEEDKEDDEDKKKEELNENMKIQDLTSSMLSTVKPKAIKTTTPKTSTPKTTKKCDCKGTCKKEKCDCKKEKVEEAETEATGEELRSKVFNSIENVFKSVLNENNKIEMRNIEKASSPCYFVLITLKTRDTQTTDEK